MDRHDAAVALLESLQSSLEIAAEIESELLDTVGEGRELADHPTSLLAAVRLRKAIRSIEGSVDLVARVVRSVAAADRGRRSEQQAGETRPRRGRRVPVFDTTERPPVVRRSSTVCAATDPAAIPPEARKVAEVDGDESAGG